MTLKTGKGIMMQCIMKVCARPLKSHDFVVRLTVFSSISRSYYETGNSHDIQRHKLKRCNFLYNFIFGLLG